MRAGTVDFLSEPFGEEAVLHAIRAKSETATNLKT